MCIGFHMHKVILLSLSLFVLNALMCRCACVQGHCDLFIVTKRGGGGCSYLEIAVTYQLHSLRSEERMEFGKYLLLPFG